MANNWPTTFATLSWLDAVNLLLASISADEVTTADPSLDSDVALAIKWLNAKDLDVQARGWAWNSSMNLLLTPSPQDGSLVLPDTTLGVNAAYWANLFPNSQLLNSGINSPPITPPCGGPALVAQRGLKLYDQVNNTFVFTQGIYVDIVERLQWDDLPSPAKDLVTMLASMKFQATKQGANIVFQADMQDIKRCEALLETGEDRARPANSIGGNLSSMRSIYGSGVRRNRGVF